MIVWALRCSKTNRIMKGRADGARMSVRSRQILWWCKDVLYTCNPIHQWHIQIKKTTQFVHWLKNLKSANYFCILLCTNSWILAQIQLSIFHECPQIWTAAFLYHILNYYYYHWIRSLIYSWIPIQYWITL